MNGIGIGIGLAQHFQFSIEHGNAGFRIILIDLGFVIFQSLLPCFAGLNPCVGKPNEIKQIIVVNGPGSFTGVRLGIRFLDVLYFFQSAMIIEIGVGVIALEYHHDAKVSKNLQIY